MTIGRRIMSLFLGLMVILMIFAVPVLTHAEEEIQYEKIPAHSEAPVQEQTEDDLEEQEEASSVQSEDGSDLQNDEEIIIPEEGYPVMQGPVILGSSERDQNTWSVSRILQYAVNIPTPENGEDFYRMPHRSTTGVDLSYVPWRVMDRALKAVDNSLAEGGLVDSEITYTQMDCSNFVGAFLDLYVGFSRYDLQYPRTADAPDINSRYLTTVYWYYRFWRDNDSRYTDRVIFVPQELRNNGKTSELEAWMKDRGIQRGDLILYASNSTEDLRNRDVNMGSFRNGHISIYWGDGKVMDSVSAGTDRGPAVNAFRASVWDSQTDPEKGSVFAFLRLTEERPVNGDLLIRKVSSDKEMTDGSSLYSLEGAVFQVRDSNGNNVGRLTTGKDGRTQTLEGIREGRYTVTEVTSPRGYLKAEDVTVEVRAEKLATLEIADRPVYASPELLLQKKDGRGEVQGNCSLSGAQFEFSFYDIMAEDLSGFNGKEPSRILVFETDSDGKVFADRKYLISGEPLTDGKGNMIFPLGTIVIRETKAPEGYQLSSEIKLISITDNGGSAVFEMIEFTEEPITGNFLVIKKDAETGSEKPQGGLSFEGTGFSIINDSENTVYGRIRGEEVMSAVLDADGRYESTASLPYGDYILRETGAPDGYLIDEKEHPFSIGKNGETVTVYLEDRVKRGGFSLHKTGTGELQEQDMRAFFDLINITGGSIYMDGQEYADGETIMSFETDEEGRYEIGDILPEGRYFLRETRAPNGYELSDKDTVIVIDADRCTEVNVTDYPLRGDIKLLKTDEEGNAKGYIPFLAERLDDDGNVLESHVMVTDADGYINTAVHGGSDVNILDGYVRDGVFTDEEKLKLENRVFFGTYDELSRDRGSFLFGRYRLSELSVEDNLKNNEDLVTLNFTIDGNEEILELGKVVDRRIRLDSSASDVRTGKRVFIPGTSTALEDRVSYGNLEQGAGYRLETRYVRLADMSILGTATEDFISEGEGTVSVKSIIDTSPVGEGETIIATDRLYRKRGDSLILVAVHDDMDDADQMLYTMRTRTKAFDTLTGADDLSYVSGSVSISDRVMYENLAEGITYRIEESIYDRDSGELMAPPAEAFLKVSYDSDEITVDDDSFTGGRCGEIVLPPVVIENADLSGRRLIVTERLYDADTGELIYSHEQMDDEDQTVRVRPGERRTVKTGDSRNIAIYVVSGLIAAAALAIMLFMKKRSAS